MNTNEQPAIELPERLRIDAVETLTETARQPLDQGQPLRLDGDSVRDTDTAGLQLLAMLRREADRRGQPMTLDPVSPALESGLQRLGLEGHVQDSANQPGS